MCSKTFWKDPLRFRLRTSTIFFPTTMTQVKNAVSPHGQIEFFGNEESKYPILVSVKEYNQQEHSK